MSRSIGLVTVLAVFACATVVHAAGSKSAYDKCMDAAGGVDPAMRACDDQEFSARDAELNRVYKQLADRLDPGRKAKLRDAERAWVSFRDKECEFIRSPEDGGTMAALVEMGCEIDLTKQRTVQLKDTLKSEISLAPFREP